MLVSRLRKYQWDLIDPQLFSDNVTMANLAEKYEVPYRQITNRKYNLRDKIQKLIEDDDKKELSKLLKYLKIKDVSIIKMLDK